MKTLITVIVAIGCIGVVLGQQSSPLPKPGPEHQKLGIWVGDWQYEGQAQNSPLGAAGKLSGKSTCRWILNGFFVEFRGEETGPSGSYQFAEIDNYDPIKKTYTWNGFGSDGSTNTVTYTIDGTKVPFSGTAVVGGRACRIKGTIVFTADFMSFVDKREYSTDGKTWAPLFEGKFTKVKAAAAENAGAKQAQTPGPTPGPEQKKLQVWVGNWTVDGETKAGPLGPASKYTGKPTWEMILGGLVLEGRFVSKSERGDLQGRQILAYDGVNKGYLFATYSSDGMMIHGRVTASGNTWSWNGSGIAEGKQFQMRGTDTLSADLMSDTFTAEVSMDGKTWLPGAEEKLTRLTPAPKEQ